MRGQSGSLNEQFLAAQKEESNSFNLCTVAERLMAAQAGAEIAASDELSTEEAEADAASVEEADLDSWEKLASANDSPGASVADDATHRDKDLEDLRLQAKDALFHAIRTGRLESSLQELDATSLKLRVRRKLLDASRSGRLPTLLVEEKKQKPVSASPDLPDGSEGVETYRQLAKERLVKAALDGRLHEALVTAREQQLRQSREERSERQASQSVAPEPAAVPGTLHEPNGKRCGDAGRDAEDAEAVARRTRRALLSGLRSGGLFAALGQKKREEFWDRAQKRVSLAPAAEAPPPPRAPAGPADPEPPLAEALRLAARKALLRAAEDRSLAARVKSLDQASTARRVKQTLAQAARSGHLAALLGEHPQQKPEPSGQDIQSVSAEMRSLVKQTLSRGAHSGRLSAALTELAERKRVAKKKDTQAAYAEMQSLAWSVKETLGNAAHNGRLAAVLAALAERKREAKNEDAYGEVRGRSVKPQEAPDTRAGPAAAGEPSRAALAQRLKESLAQAARSGRLAAALAERARQEPGPTEEIRDLRGEAWGHLLGADNGDSPSAAAGELSRAALTLRVKEVLIQGAKSGGLAAALAQHVGQKPQTAEQDLQDDSGSDVGSATDSEADSEESDEESLQCKKIRLRAKQMFVEAAGNGQLISAIQQARLDSLRQQADSEESNEESCQCEQLRLCAKQMFAEAAGNGRLISALQQARSGGLPEQADSEESDEESRQCEKIRLCAKQMFVEAAGNGQLTSALKQARLDSLRQQAKQTFLRAAGDGCMLAALKRLRSRALVLEGEGEEQPDSAARRTTVAVGRVKLQLDCPSAGTSRSTFFAPPTPKPAAPVTPKSMVATPKTAAPVTPKSLAATPKSFASASPASKATPGRRRSSRTPNARGERSPAGKPPSRDGGRRESAAMSPQWRSFGLPTSASESALPCLSPVTSTSRFSSRLRAASLAASAMALDLGGQAPPDAVRAVTPQGHQTPLGLRACASMGSLRVSKSPMKRAPAHLPALSGAPVWAGVWPALTGVGKQGHAEVAAWNRDLGGRSPAKWDISRAVF